jgi:hypothetical protein
MTTHTPRLQITLDEKTLGLLSLMADQEHVSKSSCAAILIREALELREDRALSELADSRYRKSTAWHSHKDAWGDS